MKDKELAMKPIDNSCPKCKRNDIMYENYCPNCGQKLDWSAK
jgi:predicted amidophosphoribosyltransferase